MLTKDSIERLLKEADELLSKGLVNIKLNKNISLEEVIITNGSLLTEDKIEKLVELSDFSPIGIQITIDGMKEVMDKRRPLAGGGSSFNLVYNNFIKLAKKYPFEISLRSNVNYDNIEPVRKLLLKIKEDMGDLVDKVVFSPHWTYETQEVYMKNEYYLPEVSQAEAMELIKLELFAQELGFKTSPACIHGPCTYVAKHGYAIDEFLRVYKCPGYLYTPKYFGIITDDGSIKTTSSQYLIEAFGEIKKCYLNCPVGALCYGGCRAMKHCPKDEILTYVNTDLGKKVLLTHFLKNYGDDNGRGKKVNNI